MNNPYTLSAALAATLRAPTVLLVAIFLSGGVGAASYDPALTEAPVAAPSGIWKEVLPDGRSVSIFEPRDPGPCGKIRPCVGIVDGVESPTEVPLPGAVWGLVAALGALSYMKWKRQ